MEHVCPFTGLCLTDVQDLKQDLENGEREGFKMAFSSPKQHRDSTLFPSSLRAFGQAFAVLICHFSDGRTWVDVIAEELLSPFYSWKRGSAEDRGSTAGREGLQVMAK